MGVLPLDTDDMDETAIRGREEGVSMAVVEAVADAAGTDPLALETPLNRVVDADALDRLFATEPPTRITFEYDGHEVVVDGDETITVDGVVAGGH